MARSLSRRRMLRQSAMVIGATAAVGSLPSLAQAVEAARSPTGVSAADVAVLEAFVGASNDTANTQTLLVPASGAWQGGSFNVTVTHGPLGAFTATTVG